MPFHHVVVHKRSRGRQLPQSRASPLSLSLSLLLSVLCVYLCVSVSFSVYAASCRDLAETPRPVHHRIPNFKGAVEANDRIATLPEFQAAQCVKVSHSTCPFPSFVILSEACGYLCIVWCVVC